MLNNLRSLVIRIATLLKGKVDKVPNKSLVSDTLITKLGTLENITQVEVTNDKKIKLTKSDGSNIESNAISGIGGNYLPLTGGTIDPSDSLSGIGIRINRGSSNISGIHLGGEPNSTSGLSEGEYYLLRSSDSKLTIRTMSGSNILDIAAFNKDTTKFNTSVQVGDMSTDRGISLSNTGFIGLRRYTFHITGDNGVGSIVDTLGRIKISSPSTIDFKKYGGGVVDPNFTFDFDKNKLSFNQGGYIHKGYLVGGYSRQPDSSYNINPIYAIGEDFKPTDSSTAGRFYGIGYTFKTSPIINSTDLGFNVPFDFNWTFYVAVDGKAKIALSGNTGDSLQAGNSYAKGFIKKDKDDNYVLLAGGGAKLLSEIGSSSQADWNTLQNKPNLDFLPLTGGAINPGNVTGYKEGIRINKATNNWSILTLGTEGTSGIQSGAWVISRNPNGEFQIGPNSDTDSGLRFTTDTSYWKGSRIATDAIIGSYDKYYGRSKNHLGILMSNFSGAVDYYKPHPIFTLSKSHLPTETTLGNMYGIGYTVGDRNSNSLVKSLNPESGTESHWGLYGTENGVPKWFLSGSGHITAEKGYKTKDGDGNMFPTLDGGTPYLGKRQITTIDLTDLPQDRYYLTYTTGTTQDRYHTIIQSVLWNSGTPSWKTHSSGFSFFIEFEYTGSGWGTIDPQVRCTKLHYMHSSVPPAIKLGHSIQSSTQYIYLRGGGKYHFHTTSMKGDRAEWKCDKVTTGLKALEGGVNLDQVSIYEDRHLIISTDMFSVWKENYQNRGYISTGDKGFETYDLMLTTGANKANMFANTSNEVTVASSLVPGAYTRLFAKGYKAVNYQNNPFLLLSNGEVSTYNPVAGDINGSWSYNNTWKNNLIYVNVPCNVALDNLENYTGLSFINRHTGTTTFSGPFTFRYIGATSFQGGYGTSCTVNRYGNEVFVHVNKV